MTKTLTPTQQSLALGALALGGFTIGTTEFATMGILMNIASGLDVTEQAAGHAITAYALGVVIGAPSIAILTARMSRSHLIMWLMGIYSAANVLSAFAPDLGLLIVGRFLAGLPHGVFFGVGAVVGTAIVGSARRGFAMSIMLGGLTVANVIGVPLSSWLGAVFGWRASFIAVGALGALAMTALLVLIPPVAPEPGARPRTELASMRNPRLWAVFAAAGIGFGGMFAVYSYVQPMAVIGAGVNESLVPILLALFGTGMTVGIFLAGRMMDIDVKRTVNVGFVTTSGALIFLGLTGSHAVWLFVGVFLVGLTSQYLALGLQGLLMDLSPKAPSLGAALCHSALNLANANGAFLGGLVIARPDSYQNLAWLGVVLTVVGFVLVTLFTPPRPSRLDVLTSSTS
ncbi:MFS transporter [Jonesia quinghaiensis]|uniref:MFS transporter n=1 Tax=Jonesia quinghaiensis TaxID=262806 RepID=UPI0004076BDD|nr:MFS transporter [Jonesia quinghaiensis]